MNKRWPTGIALAALAWYASDSLRHRREGGRGYELIGDVDVRDASFLRAAEALTGAPISYGNDVDLLINGDNIFPAFLKTIEDAEHSVNLLTYVYWTGDIAVDVASALCKKAKSGVVCNVLLDAVGALKMDSALIDEMEQAGVRVRRFRPVKPYAIRRVANRTHRKILVADGKVAMTGGVGIADEWTGDAHDPDHWRDTHVRIVGPAVRGLQGAFTENWLEATGEVLAGEDYLPDLKPVEGGGAMHVMRSSAGVGDTEAEALFYLAIASAKRSIDLTSAYFAPRPAFSDALVKAAERGAAIRIVVPGPYTDKEIARQAGRSSYRHLLKAGIRIFEYQPTMLHAKSLVIDGAWSSVGSVNFDNRSFQLNDEATLCVLSENFAKRLTEVFEGDIAKSKEITDRAWRRRPLFRRVGETAGRLLRREL
jgi:cardiolipin synthase A/B